VRGVSRVRADVAVRQPALDRHATALADLVAEGTARDAGRGFVLVRVLVHCVPQYPYRSEEPLHPQRIVANARWTLTASFLLVLRPTSALAGRTVAL